MNKRLFFLALSLFLYSAGATAQSDYLEEEFTNGPSFERVRAARQTFIADYLLLTDKEAERFFPMFWRYETERRALMRRSRAGRGQRRVDSERESLTEEEAKRRIDDRLAVEAEILDLRRRAVKEFLTVLPATKVMRIEAADRAFRKSLVERVRNRRARNARQQGVGTGTRY
ncbi:MAG: hypothetical protein AAFQ37_09950 [Bacteroidota bacterium]